MKVAQDITDKRHAEAALHEQANLLDLSHEAGALPRHLHRHLAAKTTGVGIVTEKLPQIFELSAQGERSIARAEGRLGLGLTIVRTLAEMHGGSITASSNGPRQGSDFTVRLPAAAASAPGGRSRHLPRI